MKKVYWIFKRMTLAIFFLGSIYISYTELLKPKLIGEASFLALIALIMIFTFVAAFYDKITEIGLGGNVIKLQGVTEDAKKTMKSLKDTQIEFARMLIPQYANLTGGMISSFSTTDPRVLPFLSFVKVLKKLDFFPSIKSDVAKTAKKLALGQLYNGVEHYSEVITRPTHGNLYNKEYLMTLLITPQKLAAKAESMNKDDAFVKAQLLEALEYYDQLYQLAEG